ncbi:MAG: HAD family hydrolase [Phycisphaeraceae bacterium]|nr:HAD family hydrolase [Phycisphaeraceae bacterium]
MRLAIFDLDGTLAQTSAVDDACWIRAVEEAWGIRDICTDWGAYRHSTDEAIATEIMERHAGRPATRQDLNRLRDRFAALIEIEASERPERFTPTPGAAALLRLLPSHGWTPALATGGWQRTALIKLRTARIDAEDLPAAFADDAQPREEIIDLAARRAMAGVAAGIATPTIVYIGDGVWDVTAAHRRGYGFIGVAREPRATQLRAAGADTVLPDLADAERVLASLNQRSARTSS